MPQFQVGRPVETTDPSVEVTVDGRAPLAPGRRRFRLVVVDDAGLSSDPAEVDVIVRDNQKPTAVIDAPPQVDAGQSFTLSGRRSADLPPGRIVKYIWTLLT
jgi:hypothetical protein